MSAFVPRLRDRLATTVAEGNTTGLTALALLVGVGAGLGAIAFHEMIQQFTLLFSGHEDYSAVAGAGNPHVPGLGPWFVLITPVIGGLIYGPLVAKFAPEARGHGVPEVMLAVSRNGGRIRPQVPAVKSLASAICIGSGGSVGREGPIVQIGSALGSALGQFVRAPESNLRLLVACGAAGGISATFNAPIAGVFFALELVLRNFRAESFGLVVLSSVTAAAIGRAAFGNHPFLALPDFGVPSAGELPLYAGLGVLAVVVGLGFMRILYWGEDLSDRIWRGPEALRPVAGGVLLGVLLLLVPQMYGVGYPVLLDGIMGQYAILALLGLLVAKILATSLTMWIGGSGGVFAPSLFMGGMLGSAYGAGLHAVWPQLVTSPGAYGLVGMGAVFAAAARTPITAVLIMFELTNDYRIILPLMLAIVVATALANALTNDTIYTLKLLRRGIDLSQQRPVGLMAQIPVGDAMVPAPAPLSHQATTHAIAARFADTRGDVLPVVDADDRLAGVIAAVDLERLLEQETEAELEVGAPDPEAPIRIDAGARAAAKEQARGGRPVLASPAESILRSAQSVGPRQPLSDAALALAASDDDGLPVLDDDRRLVGWLTHRDLLRAYSMRLAERRARAGAGR